MKATVRHKHTRWLSLMSVAIVLLGGYIYIALFFPLPDLKPTLQFQTQQPAPSSIIWPTDGESAVGVYGTNIISTHGTQTAVPAASTAKLLTALCILRVKPLAVGSQGPTITLEPADVTIYNSYVSEDGSVVPVVAGEQLSEYEMLEAMLLPSANNMADSLAIWAFGSLSAYTNYATQYAQQLGLTGMHVGSDASGFSPTTTATPTNLVQLGEATLRNPILAPIVSKTTVSGFPVVSTIKNVNQLLGVDKIIGVKTGNSTQAGGVYISASIATIGGKPVTIVTALAHAPTLYDAQYTSLPLITSAQKNFTDVTVVTTGQIVGTYKLPWGGQIAAITKRSLMSENWNGSAVRAEDNLFAVSSTGTGGQVVGSINVKQSPFTMSLSSPVVLQKTIPKPPTWWRLLHPKGLFAR